MGERGQAGRGRGGWRHMKGERVREKGSLGIYYRGSLVIILFPKMASLERKKSGVHLDALDEVMC